MTARIRNRTSISLVLFALFIACTAYLATRPNLLGVLPSPSTDEELSLNEGWTTENGAPVNFNDLGSLPDFAAAGATVQLRLPESIPSQAELNFVSSNLRLRLYFDDEEVYEFGFAGWPEQKPYATHFNFAPLDPSDAGKLARLELRPVHSDMAARLVDVRIAETSAYTQDYVTSHLLALTVSLITVVIGFSVIAFDIVLRKINHGKLDLRALGSAIIFMGVWSATVTKVPQLITGQVALVAALEYTSLLFVPYPILCFASSLLLPRNRKRYNFIARVFAVATIAITMLLALTFGTDMHQLLPLTHAQLLACAVLIAMEVVSTLRGKARSDIREAFSSYNAMMVAFLFFMACAVADFVVFTTAKSGVSDTAFFARLGLFVFSAVLAIEAARTSLTYINRAAYADKIEVIAYTDALTNIGNSTSWKIMRDEVESALAQGTLSDAVVCQFDVNFLKKVNDTYGHAAGDRYIKHAANTIQRSFGIEGTCYRTGGDEFTAIIAGENLDERMEQCKQLFEVSMGEQHVAREGDVALSMALGFARVSEVEPHTLHEAQKLADERMYANKRAMKTERVD